jgi:hypothetical protein
LGVSNSYDIINNGVYTNTTYPLLDIIFPEDKIMVNNNIYTVSSINETATVIQLSSRLLDDISNNTITINRTIQVGGSAANRDQIKLFSENMTLTPQTTEDVELSTETPLFEQIITEDGSVITI